MASISINYGEYIIIKSDDEARMIMWDRIQYVKVREESAKIVGEGVYYIFDSGDEVYSTIKNYLNNLSGTCKRLI